MRMKRKKTEPVQKRLKQGPDDPAEWKRFVETARKIEVDESGEAFQRAFEKIVPPRSAGR